MNTCHHDWHHLAHRGFRGLERDAESRMARRYFLFAACTVLAVLVVALVEAIP